MPAAKYGRRGLSESSRVNKQELDLRQLILNDDSAGPTPIGEGKGSDG